MNQPALTLTPTSPIELILSVAVQTQFGPWATTQFGHEGTGITISNPTLARVEFLADRALGDWSIAVTSLSGTYHELKVDAAWLPGEALRGPIRIAHHGEEAIAGRVITRDGGIVTGQRIDPTGPDGFIRDRFVLGLQPGTTVVLTGRVEPCEPADIDGDGSVGQTDIAQLLGAWGATSLAADINRDGIVSAEDLAALLAAIKPLEQPAPVSEQGEPAPDNEDSA